MILSLSLLTRYAAESKKPEKKGGTIVIGHGPSSNSFFEFLVGRAKRSEDPSRQTFDNFNEPPHAAAAVST